jgi:hypothetical protein
MHPYENACVGVLLISFSPLYTAKQPELWNLLPKNTIVTVDKDGQSTFDSIQYDVPGASVRSAAGISLKLSPHLNPIVPPPTN